MSNIESLRDLVGYELQIRGYGGAQNEDSQQAETTIAIVRKEGEEMPRPEDTRCQAKKGNGRCKSEITFDMEADTWVKFCEDHNKQEKKARKEGGPRVEKFEAAVEEEE